MHYTTDYHHISWRKWKLHDHNFWYFPLLHLLAQENTALPNNKIGHLQVPCITGRISVAIGWAHPDTGYCTAAENIPVFKISRRNFKLGCRRLVLKNRRLSLVYCVHPLVGQNKDGSRSQSKEAPPSREEPVPPPVPIKKERPPVPPKKPARLPPEVCSGAVITINMNHISKFMSYIQCVHKEWCGFKS